MTDWLSSGALTLGVLPMGTVGETAIQIVAANIQAVLEIPVDILDVCDVPGAAYEAARQQYDATKVLHHISALDAKPHGKILGVVGVDLCIPILTYVFGEAQLGGRASVISCYRLRNDDDGTTAALDRYYERLAKVALHEVSHSLSLYHCDRKGCLMQFSSKVDQLDRLGLLFCDRCEYLLRESLRTWRPRPRAP